MKEKIIQKIKNTASMSLCADFWTGKDKLGYLGLTVSLIEGATRTNYLIALKHIEHPHTAQVVSSSIDDVLIDYGVTNGILDEKVVSISTDNGSNMVAGLHSFSDISAAIVEVQSDDENVEEMKQDVEERIYDEISYKKRIPCTNHLLNNNMKFGLNSDCETKEIISSVKTLIKKLRFKGTINDYMLKNNLPKLLLPPETRWQYCFDMCSSLIAIKSSMPALCSLAFCDNLTIAQYDQIESVCDVLKHYSVQIKRFESADSKLSDAIPAFMNLIIELNESKNLSSLANVLLKDLKKRTKCIFDPDHPSFNAIFGFATFLDPSTKKYLGARIPEFDIPALKSHVYRKIRRKFEKQIPVAIQPKAKVANYGKLDSLILDSTTDQDELSK